MKHEWRKAEKTIYIPKAKPELIEVPTMNFITIEGKGNPNDELFSKHIEALYGIAYTLRMMPKGGFTPPGYFEYTVYPLEGLWDLSDKAKAEGIFDKDELVYKIMIRQPEFITSKIFEKARELAKIKKGNPLFDFVKFETIEDGQSVQMLHVGSYDDEPQTFAMMQQYCEDNDLILRTKVHREIYLSDFRRVVPEKLKTTLRYMVEPK